MSMVFAIQNGGKKVVINAKPITTIYRIGVETLFQIEVDSS